MALPSDQVVCIEDLEKYAKNNLPNMVWDYYNGGANSLETMKDNRAVYSRYKLRPRVMRNVNNINLTSTKLHIADGNKRQGKKSRLPVGISPAAMQCLCNPDGELAMGKAAAKFNVPMILSTFSTVSLEDVIKTAKDNEYWFQLYIYKNRKISEYLVRKAEKAGFTAVVVTVDTPVLGRRHNELKNGFHLPAPWRLANFPDNVQTKSSNELAAQKEDQYDEEHNQQIQNVGNYQETNLDWDDVIPWLRSITKMKIILKGILTEEDTLLAISHGVDGVMVSNHGGRQLDGVLSTLDALPECVSARNKSGKFTFPIYVDGGIRQGSDIVKALCLGADGVFIGRAPLWGLSWAGQAGVEKVLEILEQEIHISMSLLGVTDVADLNTSYLARLAPDGTIARL